MSAAATTTTTVAAAATTVASISSDIGQREAKAVKSIQESFHIDTLLNYLPIIVLAIIILIGIVSSDLLKDNWSIFATLVIVFVWISFIHYLSPTNYLKLAEDASTFLPKLAPLLDISSNLFLYIGVPILIFGLGLGLGFGSINVSNSGKDYDPSNGMISVGSIMLVVSFLYLLFVALKYIPGLSSINIIQWVNDKINYLPLPLIILLIIIGIPLVVRGNEIKSDFDGKLNADEYNKNKFQESLATSGAETMLGIGIFFQIAVFIAVGYFLWNFTSGGDMTKLKYLIIIGIIGLVIFMPGGIFLSKSLGGPGPGIERQKNAQGQQIINTFEDKAFMVHAVIYLIFGVIFLFILSGQTEQFTVVKGLHIGLPIILFIFIIVAASIQQAENDNQMKMYTLTSDKDSVYYKQLRDEAVKELKKTNSNATQSDIEKSVEDRLGDLVKKSQGPTTAIMWTFSIISLIIVGCIGFFWIRRKTLISDGRITSTEIKKKIEDDKMLSDDWDKLLTANDSFSSTIRFAKWFSFTPFLSVILLVMWVSVLFTNVTTSPTTTNWIGKTFSGDMFPRVKELIDAFFIVIIAGLSLCAILLLPVVKEMNAGGLESILKFAESIQVWQFNTNDSNPTQGKWIGLLFFLAVFFICLSWWWDYLVRIKPADEARTGASLPVVPDNWGWAISFVVLLAICAIPTGYHIFSKGIDSDFKKEIWLKRWLRQILTTIYLVPWLIIVLFRLGLYSLASLTGIPEFDKKRVETINLLKFWEWDAKETDLRMFQTGAKLTPASVTSVLAPPPPPRVVGGVVIVDVPLEQESVEPLESINETKVGAIGKLIKVILLTISFVILILAIIYYVYKIDAEFINKSGGATDTASGGFAAQMNSPTAHTIYVLIAMVGIAGLVAYLREKFTKANNKTPENYLFDDMKTEDETNPLRQLAFGATHIIYVILMVVVWIYDRDKDDKNRMSVTGMTILGLAILFFHYGLEFIDNLRPAGTPGGKPATVSDLLTNMRFIINTVFFIVLCALAYYKQHGVMVVLILAMFIFHLTKSIIGLKLLKLLWLGIIYIPCLFLDLLQSSQSAVGDTTRPIWIIVAIELVLIAILYGGPYLLNYIGASASQIVAAPVSLKDKYDTNLNTQSPQIFIFHNTGIDRTPEDKAANCPAEEKKRYNYSISGWFILNNTVSTYNGDLEIFNFGDVPRLTYNTSTNEMKLWCKTLDMSGNPKPSPEMIYNSKASYNTIISGKSREHQTRLKMLVDNDEELDTPVPLQKWNYFVVNYNGKTMDFFLNNKLIIKSDFMMPDIQMKPITIGDSDITTKTKGLNGSICNFAFHKFPLTKEQIRWTYNMLKSQNPPMIGMTTIEDDVKAAGSTTVYAK